MRKPRCTCYTSSIFSTVRYHSQCQSLNGIARAEYIRPPSGLGNVRRTNECPLLQTHLKTPLWTPPCAREPRSRAGGRHFLLPVRVTYGWHCSLLQQPTLSQLVVSRRVR